VEVGLLCIPRRPFLGILSEFEGNLESMSEKGKKSKRQRGWLSLFSLSSVAGLLSIALILPFAWLGGLGVSATLGIFQNLPDFIKPVNAAES